MSDEPQGLSVEDDPTPAPTAVAEPQPVTTPEPEPAPAEPDVVEVAGQKRVPLAALQAAREEARAAKEKAAKFDEVAQWYQASRPAIDFLQQNPHLMQPRQQQPTTTAPEPQQTTNPQWVTLAQTLDLYTPDGKPDVERAQKVAGIFGGIAQERATEAVKPYADMTARERANINYQRALQVKLPDGRPVNKQLIDHIWRGYEVNQLADENIASVLVYAAIGADTLNSQAPVPAPTQPPVVTEPAGGRNLNRAPVSEMETRVANIRGISGQKWAELTSKFQPGGANTLED